MAADKRGQVDDRFFRRSSAAVVAGLLWFSSAAASADQSCGSGSLCCGSPDDLASACLISEPSPTPRPTRTPTPREDPCALPTAPLCPVGSKPECFSNGICTGCSCSPCLPCPPGFHFSGRVNVCECTHEFHRISGYVGESPGDCAGRMRGVTVRLQPYGETATTSVAPDPGGTFEFERVAPGDYLLTVEPRCNALGCWDAAGLRVVDEDVSIALCPREGDAVRLNIGSVTGAPGSLVEIDVDLDSGARPVAAVSHTMLFYVDVAIQPDIDGAPACTLNPEIDAQAIFAYEPEGCTPGVDCTRVHADVESNAGALPDGNLYRCRVEVPFETTDSCENGVPCEDAMFIDPTGKPLDGDCPWGKVTSAFPLPELDFGFQLTPEHPTVGDAVELSVSVSGGGRPTQHILFGLEPVFSLVSSDSTFRTVVYHLEAVQAGTAELTMSAIHETELGCPGHTHYGYTSDASDPFFVTVAENPSMETRTPTTTPCPTSTPIHCDSVGFRPQCDCSGCGCACHCEECPPCPEGNVHTERNSCFCSAEVALPTECPGDCDADGRVAVSELIAGVSIALGANEFLACDAADSDGDGRVAIDDLTRAVVRAIDGCPGPVR